MSGGGRPRRAAVLVLVLAAILLLAGTVTLIVRRTVLTRRAVDSAAAVAQAESVWVAAAEVVRRSGSASDLQFSLPDRGTRSRRAVARLSERDDGVWELEVQIEQQDRVIARRRGVIPAPEAAGTADADAVSQESEGESQ